MRQEVYQPAIASSPVNMASNRHAPGPHRSRNRNDQSTRSARVGKGRFRAFSEDTIPHTGSVAYASDLTMLVTALVPHALVPGSPDVMMASLDHSMWSHRPFRGDEWLLHETESPIAHGGRALTRGEIYNQAGHLVASITQDDVLRRRRHS